MLVLKCCTQYASKFGKLSSIHRTGKGQFSFQFQRRAMPKNVQTTTQLHLFHILANNAQNPPSWASTVCELRTFRCTSWISKRQRNRDPTVNTHLIIEKLLLLLLLSHFSRVQLLVTPCEMSALVQ